MNHVATEELAGIDRELARGDTSGAPPTVASLDALLDAVYAELDDDAPRMVLGSTAPAVGDVGRNQVGPVGLGADDSAAFWTTQGDGTIWTNGYNGGAPRAMLVDAAAGPARIALDATTVFWVGQADGSVRKVPKGGGEATLLETGIKCSARQRCVDS